MQIAMVGAGYSGAEADRLRRDMAAWKRTGSLAKHRERLLAGFRKNGISEEFGERLYQQIHGFADYGFPESHACSFALLAYGSSWLKYWYPAEFAAGLINSQPMGFYSPSTILEDAKRHEVLVDPIDVQRSEYDCTVDAGTIRLGLRLVKGLPEGVGRRIAEGRPYASVEDVIHRAALDRKSVNALAESGALDGLSGGRREALWDVAEPAPEALFEGKGTRTSPGVERPKLRRMSTADQLVLDYERTGVSVEDHPMKHVRPRLPKGVKSSEEILTMRSGTPVTVAGLVICRQRPGTASGVVFVTMEDELGFTNLVLWNKTFEKFRQVAVEARLMLVHGKIERSDDPKGLKNVTTKAAQSVVYVMAERLEDIGRLMPSFGSMSRDFH